MINEYKHVFGNNFIIVDTANGLLNFYNQKKELYYSFKIDPCIEYEQDKAQKGILDILNRSGNAYIFKSEDKVLAKEIHLEIMENHIDYWVEAEVLAGETAINFMHYGQETLDQASASTHKFEEFFIMCPDRYGTRIPKTAQAGFKLGIPSFQFTKDNNFPHEGGRTIISPYVTALKTKDHWLGIGTMEIPDSQWGLNMTFENGRAVTDFFYGGSLKIKSCYSFPKISFFEGSDKLSACKSYIRRLYDSGLATHNQNWDASWAGPIYCFFSDQMYEYQTDRTTPDMEGEMTMTENYCNENFLKTCLDFLIEKSINYKIIIMDYGWFVNNGDWTPNTRRFKDFKATIKKLQSMSKKVLVWYSPYFLAENTPTYHNNPDIVVNKKDGSKFFIMRFRTEKYYQSDYTHPEMRKAALKDIQYLLSSAGLDADGIKVDCTHQPPLIDNVFYDPSWGLGERFHYKASKFIYDQAKKIKPNCCINATAGNPFFNNTYDIHRIHDALEYNVDAYEERAWAAWFCEAGICDLDDWPSYDLYTVRSNLRKIAYGVPSIYAARKRGGERKTRCSFGYARTVTEQELELISTLLNIYDQAPIDYNQKIHIDPFCKIFWRKHTTGKLKDFYAATTLCGNQAAVVYNEEGAKIACIAEEAVTVPVPPKAKALELLAIKRDGTSAKIDFETLENEIIFEAKRCVGDLKHYQLNYTI